ncbi:MAG: Pterin-4-alpha-carbinolamine dehydratase, partial [uncultured Sphingomonas sp.]
GHSRRLDRAGRRAGQELPLSRFRGGVCLSHPSRAACGEGRPPPGVHFALEPGRLPPDHPRCRRDHRQGSGAGAGARRARRWNGAL